MIDPMIAVSHVLRSKNSSSGCASKIAAAMNPPMIAPAIPMSVVTMMPPGSSPGRIAFAIAPAMSPRMMNAMIPMVLLVGCKEVPVLWTEKTSSRRSSCGFERHGPGGLPAPERHDRERKRRKELPSGDEEQHRPGAPVLKQRPDDNEADRSGEERHRQDARHDLGAKSLGRAHRE